MALTGDDHRNIIIDDIMSLKNVILPSAAQQQFDKFKSFVKNPSACDMSRGQLQFMCVNVAECCQWSPLELYDAVLGQVNGDIKH